MKRRNPLFVAAFPYVVIFVGYLGLVILQNFDTSDETASPAMIISILFLVLLVFIGLFYTLYWLIATARTLRRETGLKIPFAILLIIPLANYWWMWRYSQAAGAYLKGKQQDALLFVLIALLGSIGNGILQDMFNKELDAPKSTPAQN